MIYWPGITEVEFQNLHVEVVQAIAFIALYGRLGPTPSSRSYPLFGRPRSKGLHLAKFKSLAFEISWLGLKHVLSKIYELTGYPLTLVEECLSSLKFMVASILHTLV